MESVELDFQILDPNADGLEMSVLLVAAKRDLIEGKLRLLTDAEVAPSIVDVDAVRASQRVRAQLPRCDERCRLPRQHRTRSHQINILDDGVPLLTRDIAVGTRRFREDLQRERGLSVEEAMHCCKATIARRICRRSPKVAARDRRGHRARRRVLASSSRSASS